MDLKDYFPQKEEAKVIGELENNVGNLFRQIEELKMNQPLINTIKNEPEAKLLNFDETTQLDPVEFEKQPNYKTVHNDLSDRLDDIIRSVNKLKKILWYKKYKQFVRGK